MRKTVLVLFLALVLTVPFAAAEAGEQEFLGIWYGTQVGMGETMLPISMMGIEATMDIREDGTVLMSSNGEETNGTWTPGEPGTIVIDDGETPQAAAKVHTLGELADDPRDVEDPIGRPIEVYRQTADEIQAMLQRACGRILAILGVRP